MISISMANNNFLEGMHFIFKGIIQKYNVCHGSSLQPDTVDAQNKNKNKTLFFSSLKQFFLRPVTIIKLMLNIKFIEWINEQINHKSIRLGHDFSGSRNICLKEWQLIVTQEAGNKWANSNTVNRCYGLCGWNLQNCARACPYMVALRGQ